MKIISNSKSTTQFGIGDVVSAYHKRDEALIVGFSRVEIIGIKPCNFLNNVCNYGALCFSDKTLYTVHKSNREMPTSHCGGYPDAPWEYRKEN